MNDKPKNPIMSYLGVFFLGVLVAVNIFFGWMAFYLKGEVDRMKMDDMTLAQGVNVLSQQMKVLSGGQLTGPIIESADGAATNVEDVTVNPE